MSARPSRDDIPKSTARVLKRSTTLAIACQEAASDEEIAEWLLTIAIDGEWPQKRAEAAARVERTVRGTSLALETAPPDQTVRMQALKEFLLRRDGQPMQAVVLKADIEARARVIENAAGTIDIDSLDPALAAMLEVGLMQAMGQSAGALPAPVPGSIPNVIDVESEDT